MKNLVLGLCSLLLIINLISIAYTLHGRSIRETELSNALSHGMEKAMELLLAEDEHAPQNHEEWIAYFLQAFLAQIDSNSEIRIHVLDADDEKGLLSVEAVSRFRHPAGTVGSVSARRTMILEQYSAL